MLHQRAGKEYVTDRANDKKVQGGDLLSAVEVHPEQVEDAKIDEDFWKGRGHERYSSLFFPFGQMGKVERIDHVVVFYFGDLELSQGITGGWSEKGKE